MRVWLGSSSLWHYLWIFLGGVVVYLGTLLVLFVVANVAGLGTADVETALAVVAAIPSGYVVYVLPDSHRASRMVAVAERRLGHAPGKKETAPPGLTVRQRRRRLWGLTALSAAGSAVAWVVLGNHLRGRWLAALVTLGVFSVLTSFSYGRGLARQLRVAVTEGPPAAQGNGPPVWLPLAAGAGVLLGAVVPGAGMTGLCAVGGLFAGVNLGMMALGLRGLDEATGRPEEMSGA